jgi:hypothetical protein
MCDQWGRLGGRALAPLWLVPEMNSSTVRIPIRRGPAGEAQGMVATKLLYQNSQIQCSTEQMAQLLVTMGLKSGGPRLRQRRILHHQYIDGS